MTDEELKQQVKENIIREIEKINPEFASQYSVYVNDVHRFVNYLFQIKDSNIPMQWSFTELCQVKDLQAFSDFYDEKMKASYPDVREAIKVWIHFKNPS